MVEPSKNLIHSCYILYQNNFKSIKSQWAAYIKCVFCARKCAQEGIQRKGKIAKSNRGGGKNERVKQQQQQQNSQEKYKEEHLFFVNNIFTFSI